MNTEAKIRDCADKIMRDTEAALVAGSRSVMFHEYAEEIASTLRSYFGQPEQPSCKPDCKMCSGEYCATHYAQPCDCDVIDRHKELDVYPLYGCFTGDCPHSNANECVESLKHYVAELERQVYSRELVQYGETKPEQPDKSTADIEDYVEMVKSELQKVSKGEYHTWGFVQMFFDIMDKKKIEFAATKGVK